MDENPKKKEPGRPGSPRTASRPEAKSWAIAEKLADEFTRAVLTAFPEDAQELLTLRAVDREARHTVLLDAQAILDGYKSARRTGIPDSEDENAGRELYQLAEALIHGAPPPALRTIPARKFLAHLNDAREKAEALAAAAQRVLGGDLSGAKAEAAEPVKWYLAGNCWRNWEAWLIWEIKKKYELPDEALRKLDLITMKWEKRKREISLRLRALYKEIGALRAQAEAADNPAESARLNAICEKKVAETRKLIEQERELIEQERKQGKDDPQLAEILKKLDSVPKKKPQISAKTAAEIWGVSEQTIRNWDAGRTKCPEFYPGRNVTAVEMKARFKEYEKQKRVEKAIREGMKNKSPFIEAQDATVDFDYDAIDET